MARGGARLGSGPKPRSMYVVPQGAAATTGAKPGPQSPPPEPEEGLSKAERAIWVRWAPHAHEAGMLSPAKQLGFAKLCKDIALYDELKRRLDAEGWTFQKVTIDGSGKKHREQKRHTLWGPLQNVSVRVEQGLTRFGLTANGRPASGSSPRANPWA